MRKIGVEEHFTGAALQNYMKKTDPSRVSTHAAGSADLEKRFKDMDEAGVDMQVLSVGMTGLTDIPPADGIAVSREIDDEIASVVKKYPTKFAGFAALAAQDPEKCADELERAVKKLGLKGGLLNSHIRGEYLDEPKFRVLLERATALDVPIYIHPNRPSPGMIKPYEKYPILAGAFWGFAAETGLHAMRLICSGVFDELPGLKIILGHMGEALPYWMWRMDRHWATDWRGGNKPQKTPTEYIKNNFYINNSGMFWPTVIQFAYNALGADRIMLGSDYPIESMKQAVESIQNTQICDEDKEKIFHGNAEKLLKL